MPVSSSMFLFLDTSCESQLSSDWLPLANRRSEQWVGGAFALIVWVVLYHCHTGPRVKKSCVKGSAESSVTSSFWQVWKDFVCEVESWWWLISKVGDAPKRPVLRIQRIRVQHVLVSMNSSQSLILLVLSWNTCYPFIWGSWHAAVVKSATEAPQAEIFEMDMSTFPVLCCCCFYLQKSHFCNPQMFKYMG